MQKSNTALKLNVLIYAIAIIGVCYFSTNLPANAELNMYFTKDLDWTIIRLLSALGILVYASFKGARVLLLKMVLAILGFTMLFTSLFSLVSNGFIYIKPLDFFVMSEGAILALICSLQFPARNLGLVDKVFNFYLQKRSLPANLLTQHVGRPANPR